MAPLNARPLAVSLAVATLILLTAAAPAHGHGSHETHSILVPFLDTTSTFTGFTVLGSARGAGVALPNGIASWNIPVVSGQTFYLGGNTAMSDFDVGFSNGGYVNGPGDEAGFVPGTGHAVVFLFFGIPNSSFTWHEGF